MGKREEDGGVVVAPQKLHGVIVEVRSVKQAKIAENAGACAVTVSEFAVDHIVKYPSVVKKIKQAVRRVPVIAK